MRVSWRFSRKNTDEVVDKRLGAVGRGLGCRCGAGKFSRRNRPQVAPR